jgi:HK97 gp10 family phage protein
MAGNKGFFVDVENAEKAISDLRFYRKKKRKQVGETVKKNARRIQTKAKKNLKGAINSKDTVKSIKYKMLNDGLSSTIGPRRPKGYKAHWFEFGTVGRVQKTTGRYVGKMKATPFMRPAFEHIKPKYMSELKKDLRD